MAERAKAHVIEVPGSRGVYVLKTGRGCRNYPKGRQRFHLGTALECRYGETHRSQGKAVECFAGDLGKPPTKGALENLLHDLWDSDQFQVHSDLRKRVWSLRPNQAIG
jgi:hypothetical protein